MESEAVLERIAVALLCMAIVVGLVGGYVLGFVIYEPQVRNLRNKIETIDDAIETLENRSWHEVFSVEAADTLWRSNIFNLKGKRVRVTWEIISDDPTAELRVTLWFANGTPYGIWGDSGTWSVDNAELELVESGDYYLSIGCYQMMSYWVAVHDYY